MPFEKPSTRQRLANNLPPGFEEGASVGLAPQAITKFSPHFYSGPPPPTAPGLKSMEGTETTRYYTPIFQGRVDQAKLRLEGAGILIDQDGRAQVMSSRGKKYEMTPENMRGRGAGKIKETLTTYRTIAVDPSIIPLGSWVYVDYGDTHSYTGWYRAEDTGGGIKGNQIDIFTGVGKENYRRGGRDIPSRAKRIVWFEDGKIHTEKGVRREEAVQTSVQARDDVEHSTAIQAVAPKPSGEIHGKYLERIKEVTPETAEKDHQRLSTISIEELRTSNLVLTEKPKEPLKRAEGLRDETARRIAAFTSKYENDWYTIDYQKQDRGRTKRSHEMNTGLGEICAIDPDITNLMVDRGGEIIMCHRGIVPNGKHKGRLAFLDESNNYVATHTGDRFKILNNEETNIKDQNALTTYIGKFDTDQQTRTDYKEEYRRQVELSESSAEFYQESDIDRFLKNRDSVKEKLDKGLTDQNRAASQIPEPESVDEIPAKGSDTIRLVVGGDGDGKRRAEFLALVNNVDADLTLELGDMSPTGEKAKLDEYLKQYGDRLFAVAKGNHDKENYNEDFKDRLPNIKKDKDCYSFSQGPTTFVVFDKGTQTITDAQVKFFEARTKEATGPVILVNHVPPYQHAYGAGLGKKGEEHELNNFDKIQEIARTNLKERPFYIFSGHDHFHQVIGNYLNPGGKGAAYYGLDGKRLRSVPSAAVVDLDKKTGQIKHVYFRSARSGFTKSLPPLQHALASGNKGKLEQLRPKSIEQYSGDMITEVSETESVVDQITRKLSPNQIAMARIIEEEFKAVGLPNSIIAAAIVNAHSESGLRNIQSTCRSSRGPGGREDSWGLFQVNIPARRGRVTAEQMRDPRLNCREILREVTGRRGKRLRTAAAAGASVNELTAIFCYDIERPARRVTSAPKRGRKALAFFSKGAKRKDAIQETGTAYASKGPVKEKIDVGMRYKAVVDLKDNQDRWIVGSSTAVGLASHTKRDSGVIGLVDARAETFYSKFTKVVWPRIQHLKPPKEVVLTGLAVNGLWNNTDRRMRETIDGYMKLVRFFEGKGVKVKIATVQAARGNGPQTRRFNETIRQQYPQYCLDLAKHIETPDGKQIRREYATSDGIHVNSKGKRLFAAIIEGRQLA